MRLPRSTTRRLTALVAIAALLPAWWNGWSGRRERYLELADRHARMALEHAGNVPGLPYGPELAAYHARLSQACKRAAGRPYEDFLSGRWSPDYWFTPPDPPGPR
jgi:hypothetical protein